VTHLWCVWVCVCVCSDVARIIPSQSVTFNIMSILTLWGLTWEPNHIRLVNKMGQWRLPSEIWMASHSHKGIKVGWHPLIQVCAGILAFSWCYRVVAETGTRVTRLTKTFPFSQSPRKSNRPLYLVGRKGQTFSVSFCFTLFSHDWFDNTWEVCWIQMERDATEATSCP